MRTFLISIIAASAIFAAEAQEYEAAKKFYIIPKWIHTYGATYHNEKGNTGDGIGLDLGYRFAEGLGIEIDVTYERTSVRAIEEEEVIKENAKYLTTSLDLAYTYEANENLGILFKVGYEYEREKIADTTKHNTGLIYAAGFEYRIDEDFKFVMEYEKSTIDGPKGDMLAAGIMYNFNL